jgi:hypothetical protein
MIFVRSLVFRCLPLAITLALACGDDSGADAPDATPAADARGVDVTVDAVIDAAPGIDATPDAPELACNGSPLLCERRYDAISYPTTHNAMSASIEGWTHSDQRYGIATQLQDGIRGLMLDVHMYEGAPHLCHGSACASGRRPLGDGLRDIATFLTAHPHEVVTIIFEPYVEPALIRDALAAVGLDALLHTQPADAAWPTLRELIDAGDRLVVFTEHRGGAFPWFHDVWAYAWDTHWEFYAPEEMHCGRNRGRAENGLFIFNHFLVTDDGAEQFARTLNVASFLLGRAEECKRSSGRHPNFVTVDYYDVGDVMAVVRTLNGIP